MADLNPTSAETPEEFFRRVLGWEDSDVVDALVHDVDLAMARAFLSVNEATLIRIRQDPGFSDLPKLPDLMTPERVGEITTKILEAGFDAETARMWAVPEWNGTLWHDPSVLMDFHQQGWDPHSLQMLWTTIRPSKFDTLKAETAMWERTVAWSGLSPTLFVRAGLNREWATRMLNALAAASDEDRVWHRREMLTTLEVFAALHPSPSVQPSPS